MLAESPLSRDAATTAGYPAALAAFEEIAAAYGGPPDAAFGFAAARLATTRTDSRPAVLLVGRRLPGERGVPYAPGLARFGLDRARLLLVRGRGDVDLLWAMEEALKSGAVSAVLGFVARPSFVAGKRLDHVARSRRAAALIVCEPDSATGPSAARLRWRIAPAASTPDIDDPHAPGAPAWDATLVRRRDGPPGHWLMEWDDAAHRLRVADRLGDERLVETPRRAA